jgi:predicted nucleotidyltransferase
MAQYGWHTCPPPVRERVEELAGAFRRTLGDNLVGIYLHGSLAMACFNPERSDIDLLVVTREAMDLEAKRTIGESLLRLSGDPWPIEISFLRQGDLDPWRYPTPFDLHYGEDWREKYTAELGGDGWRLWNDAVPTDPDLAAHCTVMRERGICLHGAPIAEIFPPVPHADYVAALLYDVGTAPEWITANPVYGILNLCRVLWYLQEGRVASKDEGGSWAVENLPEELREPARQALAIYRSEIEEGPFDGAALARFVAELDRRIKTLVETTP